MAAFAEIVESLSRQVGLLHGEWLDADMRSAKEHIALPYGVRVHLSLEEGRELEEIPGTDATALRVMHDLCVAFGLGFAEENGGDR